MTLGQVEKVNVKGGQLPPLEGEETLDVEWATGIAPGATVRVYASGSLSFVDLDFALDQIIADLAAHPGMRQLSISLGLGETYMGGPAGEVATQHQKFLRLAAAGVNVYLCRAGMRDPTPTTQAICFRSGPLQAEYESSEPYVVGVGGTHLNMTTGASSESGWNQSGGGISILFDRPAWQKGPGVLLTEKRQVPDVSLLADPATGALIIYQGQVQQIGGTSWSAPTWAGFCALMNEAREKATKPRLPFLNPLIYPLMRELLCFRDIQVGTNGTYNAGAGYDLVTGIGVPNVKELIAELTR